jgi:transcriptional regulator GlxA family with amidase domain
LRIAFLTAKQDLARKAAVERSQFSRLFLKLVGESADAYLDRGRIEKAKELLRTTNLCLEAIAYAAAFLNYTTFFRSFRRITGMTPQQYRESTHKL